MPPPLNSTLKTKLVRVPLELNQHTVQTALEDALAQVAAAESFAELKALKSSLVGESAALSQLNAMIRDLPGDQKAEAGKLVGGARARLNEVFASREAALEAQALEEQLKAEAVDMTAAKVSIRQGARHPLSLLMDQVSDVFVGMGWEIADGPELENEWFNFDALNFHPDHPARAMQDTFFVSPVGNHLLLRTHTSPVQVRSMLERELPLYVLCPGRVFRTDAVSLPMAQLLAAFSSRTSSRS